MSKLSTVGENFIRGTPRPQDGLNRFHDVCQDIMLAPNHFMQVCRVSASHARCKECDYLSEVRYRHVVVINDVLESIPFD